jgi:hypothetical protein
VDAPIGEPLRVVSLSSNGGSPAASGPVNPAPPAAADQDDRPDPTPPFPADAEIAQLRFEVDVLKRQARLNALTGLCACLAMLVLLGALRKQAKAAVTLEVPGAGDLKPAG